GRPETGAERQAMSRRPSKTPLTAAKALEAASRPAEIVGQTLERALDPLTSALKRAALNRAHRRASQFPAPSASAAVGAPLVSPLAVRFPGIPAIAGVELGVGRAGLYKHERDDVLLMRFAEETTCGGVF